MPGATASACFAGMVLTVVSRATSRGLSVALSAVCAIVVLLFEAGRLLADATGRPLDCSVQCAAQHDDTSFCCHAQELMEDPDARHSRRRSLDNAWRHSIGSRIPEVHGLELGWRHSVFANEQDRAG